MIKKENNNKLEFDIEPLSLGWGVLIINESNFDGKQILREVSSLPNCSIYTVNCSEEFLRISQSAHQCSYGFWFYGGNTGNDKTFEELCEADKDLPFTRLGVLRMDVDGLGNIFKHGLEYKVTEENRTQPEVLDINNTHHYASINRKKSFSAYATFSQQLNYFFCGYLNTIRKKGEYKDHVQIVYSGGDDMFVVGKWDKVIQFAKEVKTKFGEYTLSSEFIQLLRSNPKYGAHFMDHNDFGISGGVELINVKYPIQRGAEKAGEAEQKAKDFNNKQKNAITLLNVSLSWDTEWDYMSEWWEKISDALNNGNLSKGLLRKIFNYYEIIYTNEKIKSYKSESRKPDLSWQWNMAYAFARNRKHENKDLLDKIQKEFLCGTSFQNKRLSAERTQVLITLAARLAELEYRAKQNKIVTI
jgi:CRISPR-associated protein Csm1